MTGLGDIGSALSLTDEAIALDPLNHFPYNVRLNALFEGRRYAVSCIWTTARPEIPEGQIRRNGRGRLPRDAWPLPGSANPFKSQTPDFWRRLTGEAIIRARSGDKAGAEQKLDRLRQVYGDAASTQFAEIYAQMGDKERAFAALGRGYEIKDAGLSGMKVDPFLDPLRSDPRFTALLRKMNFPSV